MKRLLGILASLLLCTPALAVPVEPVSFLVAPFDGGASKMPLIPVFWHGVAGGTGSCWTTGSDGWTVICSTPITNAGSCGAGGTADGTCFVYVKASGGSSGCTGHSTQAAALLDPCDTIQHAWAQVRTPSADQLLTNKGDVWTNTDIGYPGKKGLSATQPVAMIAVGSGARTQWKTDPVNNGDCGCLCTAGGSNAIDYFAIIGQDCYNYKNDPNQGSSIYQPEYGTTNGAGLGGNAWNWLLIEDCKFAFFTVGLTLDADQGNNVQMGNLRVRRSIIVDNYNPSQFGSGHGQNIHMVGMIGPTILFEENVIDMGGQYQPTVNTVVNPTITIASPAVVTASFTNWNTVDGMGYTFHNNGDTLPTGLSFNTCYYSIASGQDGAGKFRLTASAGNQASFTATISGTTMTTTSSQTLNVGDIVIGSGVSNNTRIVSGSGTSWQVSVSQTVSSPTPMQTYTELATSGSQSGTHQIAWDCSGGSPNATIFNHCVYLDSANQPVTFHGNIISNCSDNAVQGRPTTIMYNNLVTLSPEAGFSGGNAGNIHDNAFIGLAGWASCLGQSGCPGTGENNGPTMNSNANGTITNNLIANAGTGSTGASAIQFQDSHDDCPRVNVTIANPAVVTFVVGYLPVNGVFGFDLTCGGTPPTGIGAAIFTGSISGTTLSVSGVTGTIASGQPVLGNGIAGGTIITGGSGSTWTVNNSQTVGSETMISATPYHMITAVQVPAGNPTAGTGTFSTSQGGSAVVTTGSQSGNFRPLFFAYNNSATGNVIWNFGDATANNNIGNFTSLSTTQTTGPQSSNQNSGGTCAGSDCTRSIGSYNASLGDCGSLPGGCTATTAAFLTSARAQSKDNWRTELMAQSVNTYLGVGYGITFH